MDMTIAPEGVLITLSRRNLRALLHKLDVPDSARTLVRRTKAGLLVVKAVDDAEAYAEREPGRMAPETEKAIT
jgi:hypothetical protein